MFYISKGRIETEAKCRRRYYYQYHFNKVGYDLSSPSLPLATGIALHKGMEALLRSAMASPQDAQVVLDLDGAIASARAAMADETKEWDKTGPLQDQIAEAAALAEAMLRGWVRVRAAEFLARYEILSVEKAFPAILAPNVTLIARLDAVVRDRLDGALYVLNHKTSADKKDWTRAWTWDIQMQTEALALEQELKEDVAGCIVEGFYKGQFRDGRLTSPLIYAYKTQTPDGQPSYSPNYRRGWDKTPAWEEEFPQGSGLAPWVDWIPAALLEEQFMRSSPILKNNHVVEDWLRQVVRTFTDMEHILDSPDEQDRLDYFKQSFSKYNCPGCPFQEVCDQRTTMFQLIESGRLRERHSPLKTWELADVQG